MSMIKGSLSLKSPKGLTPIEVLTIEQYLNDQIASEMYKKFKVGLRVHLGGEEVEKGG